MLWWLLRTTWVWLLWSISARVAILVFWSASLADVVVERSPLALRVFTCASVVVVMVLIIPFIWGAYRLRTRVRQPASADWRPAEADVHHKLRQDWIDQIAGLGFVFAGYLIKERQGKPMVALFINSENRDSAHVAYVAGKEFFVFKTRYADGFAFEAANTETVRLHPVHPAHPTFRFPQVSTPADLYRVHTRVRKRFEPQHKPVVSDSHGEIAEFISRAEVLRRHMFSRDYRLLTPENVYVFTIRGAMHHAALLTWPVKAIRAAMLRSRAAKELARMGFRLDPSGMISEA